MRRETETQHLRLHGLPPFAALAEGTLSPSGYVGLLQRLHAFHAGIEALTATSDTNFGGAFANYEPASRSILLARDLDSLGATTTAGAATIQLATPESAYHLAGILYVVDGSMLGAAVLEKPARRIAGAEGSLFWRWGRVHGGVRWRRLCELLAQLSDGSDGDQIMVDTARATFPAFEAVFAPLRTDPSEQVPA